MRFDREVRCERTTMKMGVDTRPTEVPTPEIEQGAEFLDRHVQSSTEV